jgi:hypothetical protein
MRPANAPNTRPWAKCLRLEDPRRTSRRLISRVPYRSRSQFVHRSIMSESALRLRRCPTIRRLSVPTTNRIVAPGAIVDGATARTTGILVSTGGAAPLHATTVILTNRATPTVLTNTALSISISWNLLTLKERATPIVRSRPSSVHVDSVWFKRGNYHCAEKSCRSTIHHSRTTGTQRMERQLLADAVYRP